MATVVQAAFYKVESRFPDSMLSLFQRVEEYLNASLYHPLLELIPFL